MKVTNRARTAAVAATAVGVALAASVALGKSASSPSEPAAPPDRMSQEEGDSTGAATYAPEPDSSAPTSRR